jgi:hypothetical protein
VTTGSPGSGRRRDSLFVAEAKTSSRTKRVSGCGWRCLRDCFRKLISGSLAYKFPSETGTLSERWMPSRAQLLHPERLFALNKDRWVQIQTPTLANRSPRPYIRSSPTYDQNQRR